MLPGDGGAGGVKIPEGDPGALLAAAGKLAAVGESFGQLDQANGIAGRLSGTTWSGLANVNFQQSCLLVSDAGRRASSAARDAAAELKTLARELEDAIEKAQRSAEDYNDAKAAYDDAAFSYGMMRGEEGDEAAEARGRLEDRMSGAADDMTAAQQVNDDANQAAETAAEAAAARFSAIGGRAAPVPLNAQPGAGSLVLTSTGQKDSAGLRVLVFKIGGSESALVEQRADGTWAVTTADGLEAGIEADLKPGVEGKGSTETGRLGAGPDLQAALLAQMEEGQTYAFPTLVAATRFLSVKKRGEPPPEDSPLVYAGPGAYVSPSVLNSAAVDRARWRDDWEWAERQEPIESYEQGGITASVGASADMGGGASASIGAEGSSVLGQKVDHDEHTATAYYKSTIGIDGELSAPGGEAKGSFEGEAVTSVTRFGEEGDGELKSFSISATESGEAGAKLGTNLPGGSPLVVGESDAVRYERQVTLDATEPENRAAVERYLETGGRDPAAVAQLNHRLAVDGHTDVRVYGTSASATGFEADAKVVGVEFSHEESRTRLLDAEQRLPGSHSPTDIELPR